MHRSRHQAPDCSSKLAPGSTVRGGGRLKVLARLCRRHSDQAFCIKFGVCIGAAVKLQLGKQACGWLHGARRRPPQGACSSLPSRCVLVSAAGTSTRHLALCLVFASEPPSSLRLVKRACGWLHSARRRSPHGACSSLPPSLRPGLLHYVWCLHRCEAEAVSRCLLVSDHPPALCLVFASEQLPSSRLLEQACG